MIHGDDRVGAIAHVVGKLAVTKTNVTAINAVAADCRYGALLPMRPRDVKKAAEEIAAPVLASPLLASERA